MNTADLVLYALCNALMVTAVIYEVRGSSVITLSYEPGQLGIESTGKIFLKLHGSGVGSLQCCSGEIITATINECGHRRNFLP